MNSAPAAVAVAVARNIKNVAWRLSNNQSKRQPWTTRLPSCCKRGWRISLQKGQGEDEVDGLPLTHLGSEIADFADTAAIVAQLDLIICVDTVIAHLAGALGKPVWLLLPVAADWRWLVNRDDSPWYPKTTLFRQSRAGVWDDVFERVRDGLEYYPLQLTASDPPLQQER